MKPRLVMDIRFIQFPTIDVEKLRIVCQKGMKLKNQLGLGKCPKFASFLQICSEEMFSKGI